MKSSRLSVSQVESRGGYGYNASMLQVQGTSLVARFYQGDSVFNFLDKALRTRGSGHLCACQHLRCARRKTHP